MNMPAPTKEKGQRSQYPATYLFRLVPQWIQPEYVAAERWRAVVANQPIAMICKETLISNILAMDWKIEPKDSDQRDELKEDIDYYTEFLTDNGEIEYATHLEWILGDLLDLPFGAGVEVGRENDDPEGRVLWLEPLDGATLFPTLNSKFPVGQRIDGYMVEPIYFPAHAINRMHLSPRRDIRRWGWGMAPPEKIFLALQMLNRGDLYYANLLLDTPEAGILDLGDMERESAEQWVDSFRNLLGGVDPLKIPVLYEHTTETKWIPFGRPPTDLMYDKITMKLAGIIAAGYGLTLSDIGLGLSTNGGDTLAGAIRSERRTRKTGLAVLKKKLTSYMNRMLPPELYYKLIDPDDEQALNLGRARMANATAFGQWIDKRILTPQEARLQMISDGLVTISISEEVDEKEFDIIKDTMIMPPTPERPALTGSPVSPSQGGRGESGGGVRKSAAESRMEATLTASFNRIQGEANNARLEKLIEKVAPVIYDQVAGVAEDLTERSQVKRWNVWYDENLIERAVTDVTPETDPTFEEDDWWTLPIDDDELAILLSLAYQESLRKAANDLLYDLYTNGYLASPYLDPNMVFGLENQNVLRSLRTRAQTMVDNVNTGTKYYLRRALVKAIRDGLTEPEMIQRIRSGVDIQEILRDNIFMQRLSQAVRIDLTELSNYRTDSITGFEIRSVENEARLAQFRKLGLERKHWVHRGADEPCLNYCRDNIEAGYVPMDFEYKSVYGPVMEPLGHPHCHCEIGYDQQELFSLAVRGNLYIWTGD